MKVITLTGLRQSGSLSGGSDCTPVEDTTVSGEAVIRCKEAVEAMDASAPEKVVTLGRVTKRGKRKRARKPADRACVPEWITVRTKGGRSVKRCHCKHGKFVKSAACERK